MDLNTPQTNQLVNVTQYIVNANDTVSLFTSGPVDCNPRPSDTGRLQQMVFNRLDFPRVLSDNKHLLAQLYMRLLYDLTEKGFTGDLATFDPEVIRNIRSNVVQDLESLRSNKGDQYSNSMAVVARCALIEGDPLQVERSHVLNQARLLKDQDLLQTYVPATIAEGFVDEELRKEGFQTGLSLASENKRSKIIAGWSLMAGTAVTTQEKANAYGVLMKSMDRRHLVMGANVQIGLAIVANPSQVIEQYNQATSIHRQTMDYPSETGAFLAMALLAPESNLRSQIFQIASERLQCGWDNRYTPSDVLVQALTAQTDEEKYQAYKLAQTYSDNYFGTNIAGWACIALGVLGATDRDRALRSVAAVMK